MLPIVTMLVVIAIALGASLQREWTNRVERQKQQAIADARKELERGKH